MNELIKEHPKTFALLVGFSIGFLAGVALGIAKHFL